MQWPGAALRWTTRDSDERIVRENRTEALDASRQVVRDCKVIFPRAGKLMQEFAEHLAADVKQLVEDEVTGQKTYRYVRTGTNHYSFAFTYDCIAWSREPVGSLRGNLEFDAEECRRNSPLFMDL